MTNLNQKYEAALAIAWKHYSRERLFDANGPVLVPGTPVQCGYRTIKVPLNHPTRTPPGTYAAVLVDFADDSSVKSHHCVPCV